MGFKSSITKKSEEKIKKQEEKRKEKEDKPMKKINFETVKTITIAVLVTLIIAFVAGMKYQEHQNSQVKTEAAMIVKDVKVNVSKQ